MSNTGKRWAKFRVVYELFNHLIDNSDIDMSKLKITKGELIIHTPFADLHRALLLPKEICIINVGVDTGIKGLTITTESTWFNPIVNDDIPEIWIMYTGNQEGKPTFHSWKYYTPSNKDYVKLLGLEGFFNDMQKL